MTALAVSFYFCTSAQTQGTNAISLGVTVNNEKSKVLLTTGIGTMKSKQIAIPLVMDSFLKIIRKFDLN